VDFVLAIPEILTRISNILSGKSAHKLFYSVFCGQFIIRKKFSGKKHNINFVLKVLGFRAKRQTTIPEAAPEIP